HKENMSVVRGKIEIIGSIKNRIARKQLLTCEYDELSENNLLNQIIKSTVILLIKHKEVKTEYKNNLKKKMLFFNNVNSTNLTSICWSEIFFHKNNNTYHMLINLCKFIINGMLLTEKSGKYKLASFINDQEMSKLYEKFILAYYCKKHPDLNAKASEIKWVCDDNFSDMLPTMKSDIMLHKNNKILIIDAKYYNQTTQTHFHTPKLHSANLYQIFTYVKNKQAECTDNQVSGLLLYAQTDELIQPNQDYQLSGNKISVKTLDLNQDFANITKQLDDIVNDFFQAA
ncbi:MAG: hypothetical protein J6T41_01400, partial [Neisseriaceae bacterium]|nr:hypothetical protein [Neisseriaceae bacterium]